MSVKSVLVHRCKNVGYKELLFPCQCQKHVSKSRAEKLVDSGSAAWLVYRIDLKDRVDYGHLFALTSRWSEIPHAQTIAGPHILKACGLENCSDSASLYQRERIEVYGEMNQELLRSLVKDSNSQTEAL